MGFCLSKDKSLELKRKIASGELDPEKLANMTSGERHAYFSKFLGEDNSFQVNALLESKLLLKNQKQGMVTWAKTVTGIKSTVRADLIDRINKLEKVLDPASQDAFLEDLAAKKLGVGVSKEEASKIFDMAKDVATKKDAIANGGDRMEYGRSLVATNNYLNDLKFQAAKKTFLQTIKDPIKVISDASGVAKSLKASFDNSAIFRQGWKSLFTHPSEWLNNAKKTFLDAWKEVGGKSAMDELNADILSRDNALNGNYKKAGLAIGTIEEPFPSSLPEKIPVLGRFYKASESAFTGFVYRQRADIFDKYIEIAKENGIDLADKNQLKSIGRLVNSLTGRGDLGALEPAGKVINNIFFSGRKLASDIDTLTLHIKDPKFSTFARKQAAINLVKIISGTAVILATARAIKKDSVELDPRSSDFGKIRIGDTRFDVTGGMGSLITLASRLLTMSVKSSNTGKITPINSGKFGATSGTDVERVVKKFKGLVYNFLENKLSPVASVIKDFFKGKDFNGNKPTPLNELNNLLTPLPVTNFLELKDNPNSANIIVAILADIFGIGVNTYSSVPKTPKSYMGSENKQSSLIQSILADAGRFGEVVASKNPFDPKSALADEPTPKPEPLTYTLSYDNKGTYIHYTNPLSVGGVTGPLNDSAASNIMDKIKRYNMSLTNSKNPSIQIDNPGKTKSNGKILGFVTKNPRADNYADTVNTSSNTHHIPPSVLAGIVQTESGFDEKAPDNNNKDKDGNVTSTDRGLAQINTKAHPEVTEAQARDPKFAIDFVGRTISNNQKYTHNWEKSIAAYNVGLGGLTSENNGPLDSRGLNAPSRVYLNKVVKNLDSTAIKAYGLLDHYD